MLGVMLGRFVPMMGSVQSVCVCDVRMMPGLLMIAGVVMLGRFAMVVGGIFVMLGRFAVCIFRHTDLLKPEKSGIRRKRENLQELRGLEDITL